MALFSMSYISQRCLILSWSMASDMSCCTWNRSFTRLAPGNAVLTVSIMADDRSVVTVFTIRRLRSGIFFNTFESASVATPRIIATNAP